MPIHSFKDLDVWKMAMNLAADCYHITSSFPRHEIYSMTAQIRRAAASVPANIAEGHGRENTGSFIHRAVGMHKTNQEMDALAIGHSPFAIRQ
jgi:four helix bundle protein